MNQHHPTPTPERLNVDEYEAAFVSAASKASGLRVFAVDHYSEALQGRLGVAYVREDGKKHAIRFLGELIGPRSWPHFDFTKKEAQDRGALAGKIIAAHEAGEEIDV